MNVRWLQGVGVFFVLAVFAVLLRGAVTPSVAQPGGVPGRTGATMVEDDGVVYVLSNGQLTAYTLELEMNNKVKPPVMTGKRKFIRLDSIPIP